VEEVAKEHRLLCYTSTFADELLHGSGALHR